MRGIRRADRIRQERAAVVVGDVSRARTCPFLVAAKGGEA